MSAPLPPTSESTGPPIPGIRRKVLSSFAWMGSAQLLGQLVSWASTIFVIRLLDPSDYGVMAMTTVFLSLLMMLSDLGVGAALVQAKAIPAEDARFIQGFILLFNIVGLVITTTASGLVAAFFGEPRLVPILNTLSFCFLLIATYVYPQSMLQRELQYDRKAKVDFVSMCGGAVIPLGFALLGFGVWSLVAGTIAMHLLRAVGFNLAHRQNPLPRLSLLRASSYLRFGAATVLGRILWFAYSNLDLVIAGKLLTSELVGIYSVALTLSWVPLRKVMPTVNDIAFSTFSRIQSDRDRVRQSVIRSARYAFAVFLPIFWGMVLVAPDAVPILLGEQWADTVVPLQFVCSILPMRAVVAVIPPALFGVGRPRVNVITTAISLPIMAVAFVIGARFGVVGLAAAWLVAYPIVFAIVTTQSFPVLGVSVRDFWQSVRFPLLAGAVMVGAVLCAQAVMGDAPALLRLVSCVVTGGAAYSGVIYKIDRKAITDLRALLAR